MNRLSIIVRNLLTTASFALALFSAAGATGCALESGSGNGQNGTQTGADDLVQGSQGDPTAVHVGAAGNLAVEANKGLAPPSEPILESGDGTGNGPQPEPWLPPLSVRSASSEPSGSNHK